MARRLTPDLSRRDRGTGSLTSVLESGGAAKRMRGVAPGLGQAHREIAAKVRVDQEPHARPDRVPRPP